MVRYFHFKSVAGCLAIVFTEALVPFTNQYDLLEGGGAYPAGLSIQILPKASYSVSVFNNFMHVYV